MTLKQLFSSIVFVLLIGLNFGFGNNVTVSIVHELSGNQKQADISNAGNQLFGLTPESEIAVPANLLRFQVEDKSFVKFHKTILSSETLILIWFNQFKIFYHNCLIASRKSDGIFPFHYFW